MYVRNLLLPIRVHKALTTAVFVPTIPEVRPLIRLLLQITIQEGAVAEAIILRQVAVEAVIRHQVVPEAVIPRRAVLHQAEVAAALRQAAVPAALAAAATPAVQDVNLEFNFLI